MFYHRYTFRILLLVLSLSFGVNCSIIQAQVFSDEFGKNRVQHHSRFDNWTYFESDHFFTYWYGNGRNVAEMASLFAEIEIEQIETILEYRINNKIDLIVYNDITDLHQSNIGSEETVITQDNRFKTLDNKIFVYNTGNPEDLRKQIREGIAAILINYTLYGENLKEIIKNSLFEDLPNWFKPGLIAYCGQAWSIENDNDLRAFFVNNNDKQFSHLNELYPELSGHSFWYFIHSVYGKNVISNILYLVRINGDLDGAFKYVLGENFGHIIRRWHNFYATQYIENNNNTDLSEYRLDLKIRKKEQIIQGKWDPSGNQLAFVTSEFGKKRLYLYNSSNKETKCIFKTGFINKLQQSDDKYPLFDWSIDEGMLLVIYERADQIFYQNFNVLEQKFDEKKKFAPQIERVISIDHLSPKEIILSGIQRGNTDLYFFNIRSGQLRTISNDFFYEDNICLGQLLGEEGILFSTNRNNPFLKSKRVDSLLPSKALNSYFYSFKTKEYTPLSQLNPLSQFQSSPILALDSTRVLVLNNSHGVNNLYLSKTKQYLAHYRDSVVYKSGSFNIIEPSLSNSYDTTTVKEVFRTKVNKWIGSTRAISQLDYNILDIQLRDDNFHLSIDEGDRVGFYIIPKTIFLKKDHKKAQSYFIENLIKLEEKSRVKKSNKIKPKDRVTTKVVDKKRSENKKESPSNNFFFQSKFDNKNEKTEKVESHSTLEKSIESSPLLKEEQQDQNSTIDSIIIPEKERSNIKDFYSHHLLNYRDSSTAELQVSKDIRFNPSKIIPYRLKFKIDEFKTDLENSPLISGMETFLGDQNNNYSNPLSITFRARTKDLLEDYVVESALRFPTSLNGVEYFLSFENKKRQLDKKYIFYRRSNSQTVSTNGFISEKNKLITNNLIYQLKYPLNIFASLRLTSYLRLDNFITRAVEEKTLAVNSIQEQRLGARLEYVYDNTYDIDINMRGGLRYRIFVEGIKKMKVDYVNNFTYQGSQGLNSIFGIDVRWYKPVLKHSLIAIRGVSAISQGHEKVLFYLGGSRNWLVPRFDNSIPLPQDNFSFYSLATNIRGFKYNTRNGTSYGLANFELRMPVLKYLSKKGIKSDFFRSLQLVSFFDIGKTWNGWNPLNSALAQSNVTISNNEYVELNVAFYRNQLLLSYGWGLRANVFGYYMRLDLGQGVESGQILKEKIWHISMGTDF